MYLQLALSLYEIGRLRRSFVGSAAHAISPAVLRRYASVAGISSPIGRPEGLIVRRITGRRLVIGIRDPFVVGRNRPEHRSAVGIVGDTSAEAHGTTTHSRCVIGFERLLPRFAEHLLVADGRQPIRCCRGEVIASAETTTLDERPDAEFLQAGPGRD